MVAKTPERGSRGGKTGREWGEKVSPTLLPHNLLADTTRFAGCGGRLGDVLAVAPISQPTPSELQASPGGSPCGPKRLKTSSKRACPKKSSVFEKRSLSGFASGTATYLWGPGCSVFPFVELPHLRKPRSCRPADCQGFVSSNLPSQNPSHVRIESRLNDLRKRGNSPLAPRIHQFSDKNRCHSKTIPRCTELFRTYKTFQSSQRCRAPPG
jgi:hypothetical protein